MLLQSLKEKRWYRSLSPLLAAVVLLLYPLIGCNQGVDLADTGYNIATYRFMMEWDGYWTLTLPLANLAGVGVLHLPGGGTLLGVNFYTSLLMGLAAASVYLLLRRKIPGWCVFLGEVIALGTCWCPSAILYNYLTYFVILAALGTLYAGLTKGKDGLLALAGALLGINVFVRFSNLTEAMYILAVWYYMWRGRRGGTDAFSLFWKPTMWCLGGYAVGGLAAFGLVCAKWGARSYLATVRSLFVMSGSAEGYSATSMLLDAWRDYASMLPWLALMGLGVGMGTVLFSIKGASWGRPVKITFYMAGLLVLLRLFWGRRVLDTNYASDGAIWYFGVMFVVVAFVVNSICLFREKQDKELQLLSAFVLITLFIAPLGTNNHAYAAINNLFLAAPLTVFLLHRYGIRNGRLKGGSYWGRAAWFPLTAMSVFFLVCLTWQTIGFQSKYAFGDSSAYEKRDTKIENNAILKGMYTSGRKARNLESLSAYLAGNGLRGKRIYTYGDIPSLCYYLDQPPATAMLWPDLDSYEWERFEEDLNALTGREHPVFIISASRATLVDEEVAYGGEEVQLRKPVRQKLERIYGFLAQEGYTRTFSNELFVVYE